MDNESADSLFKTLSDAGRREMVRLLGEAPLSVGEMVEILRLPQSTVSRQLKALRTTGLVDERRLGTRIYNALVEPSSNGDAGLADLLNQWLRNRPLNPAVEARMKSVVAARTGGEDVFERLAHRWDDLRREYFGCTFHLEALLALLPSDWHVLDIGTGTGYLLPTLSRTFDRVTAVDPSAAMLSLARERAQREKLGNIDFQFGQLEALPVESDSIDAALAILVLHHAADLADAAGELYRVLRPGGSLLAVDFAPHGMEEFQRAMGDPVAGLEPRLLQKELLAAGLRSPELRDLPPPPAGLPEGPEKPAPQLFLIQCRKDKETQ